MDSTVKMVSSYWVGKRPSAMPRRRWTKAGAVKKGVRTPMREKPFIARARASALGTNPSWSIASWIRSRVASLTWGLALITRETVEMLTPAALATS